MPEAADRRSGRSEHHRRAEVNQEPSSGRPYRGTERATRVPVSPSRERRTLAQLRRRREGSSRHAGAASSRPVKAGAVGSGRQALVAGGPAGAGRVAQERVFSRRRVGQARRGQRPPRRAEGGPRRATGSVVSEVSIDDDEDGSFAERPRSAAGEWHRPSPRSGLGQPPDDPDPSHDRATAAVSVSAEVVGLRHDGPKSPPRPQVAPEEVGRRSGRRGRQERLRRRGVFGGRVRSRTGTTAGQRAAGGGAVASRAACRAGRWPRESLSNSQLTRQAEDQHQARPRSRRKTKGVYVDDGGRRWSKRHVVRRFS